jgi:hypothetical protein
MSLNAIIRNGIAIADNVTRDLQGVVMHQSWLGTSGSGDVTFSAAVSRRALIDESEKPRFSQAGQLILTKAQLTFLDPIAPQEAAGRVNPVDSRDIFTLPDGTTGPVVSTSGFIDAETNQPYMISVTLGK